MKLYPNPSSGLVYLEKLPDYQSIEIFDLSGKLFINRSLTGQKENVASISLDGIFSGIYMVKVYTKDAVIEEKLVVIGHP